MDKTYLIKIYKLLVESLIIKYLHIKKFNNPYFKLIEVAFNSDLFIV